MCFVKTSTPKIPKETIQEDIVKIHEADADITKNSGPEPNSSIWFSSQAASKQENLIRSLKLL